MNFKPTNRNLWVELKEEPEQDKSAVLLPEDYNKAVPEFAVVKIKDAALDCKVNWASGVELLVEASMIREATINNKTIYIILENYVLGVII